MHPSRSVNALSRRGKYDGLRSPSRFASEPGVRLAITKSAGRKVCCDARLPVRTSTGRTRPARTVDPTDLSSIQHLSAERHQPLRQRLSDAAHSPFQQNRCPAAPGRARWRRRARWRVARRLRRNQQLGIDQTNKFRVECQVMALKPLSRRAKRQRHARAASASGAAPRTEQWTQSRCGRRRPRKTFGCQRPRESAAARCSSQKDRLWGNASSHRRCRGSW